MKRAIIDLSLEPRVFTIDNFLSPAECTHMIAAGKAAGLKRGTVSGQDKGIVTEARTNDVAWVPHATDVGTKRIAARVASLVGLPLSYAESFQLIHYGMGAQYKPHFDAFDPRTSAGKRNWQNGGQRLITVLGYLNTPEKGGGTIFPKLDFEVPAEAGKLVVFHNCEAGEIKRHPHSLHGGSPVEAGEKWAFNLWFRAEKRLQPGLTPLKSKS